MLYGCLAITLSLIAAWKCQHLYIEHYLHPTNPKLSSEVRSYLRGAYSREEMDPDPAIAEKYLSLACQRILEENQLEPDSLEFLDINVRLAKAFEGKKSYTEALDVYIKIWHTLLEAANPKQNAHVYLQEKSTQDHLNRILDTGLSIGSLYLKLGEAQIAKDFLSRGFQMASDILNQAAGNDSFILPLKKYSVNYRISLGCAYVFLKDYDASMALYSSVLRDIHNTAPKDAAQLHPWGCLESKVLNYMSEVSYAKSKNISQAINWAWKAHKASVPFQETSMAGAAAGANALYTLGLLYEKKADLLQARACLSQAVALAVKSCDSDLTRTVCFQLDSIQEEPAIIAPNPQLLSQ
ncbi:hypothetical protein DSO57_1030067 [Entomophthora muscae]|uniref:Uncharacterized protein n=1 Tax=Entomophthora muscae TaxID=34485 RepID=A0ACC2S396_9FUNG|nr:hypothetical protein DSO57_1030067 [Entomophthora muscae]